METVRADLLFPVPSRVGEGRVWAEPLMFLNEAGSICFNICHCSCQEEALAVCLLQFFAQIAAMPEGSHDQSNISASFCDGEGGGGTSHPCCGNLLGSWHQCRVL